MKNWVEDDTVMRAKNWIEDDKCGEGKVGGGRESG